jgi:hypothetical protein
MVRLDYGLPDPATFPAGPLAEGAGRVLGQQAGDELGWEEGGIPSPRSPWRPELNPTTLSAEIAHLRVERRPLRSAIEGPVGICESGHPPTVAQAPIMPACLELMCLSPHIASPGCGLSTTGCSRSRTGSAIVAHPVLTACVAPPA